MPPADSVLLHISTIVTYLIVLTVPGLLIGLAAGLRGWALAGLTPLLTYAILGLSGPWLHQVGVPFTAGTAIASTLLMAALVYGVRRLARGTRWASGEDAPLVPWSRNGHLAVAGCVAIAVMVSITVIFVATGGVLDAVFQRWDPVFHANGIRYIADTGDGGLFGVSSVNRYGPEGSQFYPNAYHLAGATVRLLTGASVPATLNAITMPVAGILALSLAALVRQFGGRAVLAGSAALIAAAATNGAYESVANGLIPFALSVALTPLGAIAMHRFLTRPGVENGMVLLLAGAGLLSVHSSALFAGVLFTLPVLVQRWLGDRSVVVGDLKRLAPVAVVGALVGAPHLLGAVSRAAGAYGYRPWGSSMPMVDSLSTLVFFQHERTEPQLWLTVLLVLGLLTYRTLGSLRWIAGTAVLFSALWFVVASFGGWSWVVALSRPWWNDRYRMLALAMVPLCLLVAHGMAEAQRYLARLVTRSEWLRAHPKGTTIAGFAAAVLTIIGLGAVTNGFYATVNSRTVAHAYHNAPDDLAGETQRMAVSPLQLTAMHEMARLAVPGEKVLNDRSDGSAWLYAVSGVRTVAAHYDSIVPPKDAAYLAEHFRDYENDPEVWAALDRLNVHHVFVGSGEAWPGIQRAPGLTDLEGLPILREVYRNPDAVIYEIVRPAPSSSRVSVDPVG